MKIVIQCAASKNPIQPGGGFRAADRRLVRFVAHPELAPSSEEIVFAHPDDLWEGKRTWRDRLLDYNEVPSANPLGLKHAYQLYSNRVYEDLVEKFGREKVFILSAGWGLISAELLIPDYDITFSRAKNVKPFCRRKRGDVFADLLELPNDGESVIFLGGQDYLPLFCDLTSGFQGKRTVFFNSRIAPNLAPGLTLERFDTNQKTNWHYACAQAVIDGKIGR